MADSNTDLEVMNSSGFPLQIAVARAISAPSGGHPFDVRFQEHAWRDEATGESGYIDLVASAHGHINLIIECKRPNAKAWYFMNSDGSNRGRPKATWFKTGIADVLVSRSTARYEQKRIAAWGSGVFHPQCPGMDYCVMGDKAAAKSPLIESIAAPLCVATESFGRWYMPFQDGQSGSSYFLPVIVTTAELRVVTANPDNISLATGQIPDGECEVVPYLKMTKQLATPGIGATFDSVHQAVMAMNRTVYIVNAECLVEFMRSCCPGGMEDWPLA